jgi:hypothetical protein
MSDEILSTKIIHLPPTVGIKWLHNSSMVLLTLKTPTREAIDAWANKALDILHFWSAKRPVLLLLNLSTAMLSPYLRFRLREVVEGAAKFNHGGRYAILTGTDQNGKALALFVERELKPTAKTPLQGSTFTEQEKAEAWLKELIPADPPTPAPEAKAAVPAAESNPTRITAEHRPAPAPPPPPPAAPAPEK